MLLQSIEPLFRIVVVFGDAGFVLPASGGLAAALWAAGDRRAAVAFLAAIAVCGVMATLAKIFSMAFGPPPLHSPSGHAALAAAFFLPLSAIFMRVRERRAGILAAALGVAVAVLVAIGRVVEGAHTAPEAFAGFFIGLAAFGVFLGGAPSRLAIGAPALIVFLAAAVAIHAYMGLSIEVEGPLERIATRLAQLLSL
ncbi:phosphatase PAP2 family protein [Methylosinus sp. H3A]|uniref:phosphatase PAP2 family protein n=1 Tax=Methylosinus sp. H3A TaxID=2785786 RepID=UPI0018C2110A|nr:phosphatase PAP2 family protein [Methylosinus sp. H3A]MBG0810685.1 phosphatase PAP2 family protein [Methylosinus sp. H3A]